MAATTEFKKSQSWQMFNRISRRYDLLNHLLSFGLDIHWRHCLLRFLPQRSDLRVLDLATGTADVPLTLVKNSRNIAHAEGIDLAEEMLERGRKKIGFQGLTDTIHLQKGDANHIPFPDSSFDTVTMAFGIRNVEDPMIVFKEIYRVLKPKGRVLILEFSLPSNPLLRILHVFYLRSVVPLIGGLVSGDFSAYRYLNRTIETFPYGRQFCRMLKQVGLKDVVPNPLMGGVATIYQGDKI